MESNVPSSSGFYELVAWADANRKRLLIGAGVVVAVILVVIGFIQREAAKETSASLALSEVRVPLNFGTPVPTGTAEALDKVAKEHPGTKAGARALLQSAGLYFSEARWDLALERFERVPKEYPESPWLAVAALGTAASLEAQGKKTEATAKYEELRRRFPNSPVADDAKLTVARLYSGESAKAEEAYKLYDEIMKVNPPQYTALGREAALRQETLLKTYPQLEKLRNPPPPAPVIIPPPTIITNAAVQQGTNTQTISITNRANPNRVPPMIARPPEAPAAAAPPPAPTPVTPPQPKPAASAPPPATTPAPTPAK